MNICDMRNDNYYHLIVSEIPSIFDTNSRLRVYKGCQVINDQLINGIASSIQSVYIDESSLKIPSKQIKFTIVSMINNILLYFHSQLLPWPLDLQYYFIVT